MTAKSSFPKSIGNLRVPRTPLGCYASARNQQVPLDSNDKGNRNCTWNSNQFEMVVSLVQVLGNGRRISIIFDQERLFINLYVKFLGVPLVKGCHFLNNNNTYKALHLPGKATTLKHERTNEALSFRRVKLRFPEASFFLTNKSHKKSRSPNQSLNFQNT